MNWTKAQERKFLEDVLTTCITCEFSDVSVYGTEEFLPAGAKVDLIGLTMLWWDMSGGGDGQIVKLVEYNKVVS